MKTNLAKDKIYDPLITEVIPKFFKAFCDPTRIKIIEYLIENEKNVTELTDLLGISQSGVSNHLACLKWCGFVTSKKEGRTIYYNVTDKRIKKIVELAKQVIADNAENIYVCTRLK